MKTQNGIRNERSSLGPAMPSLQEIDATVAGARRAQASGIGRLLTSYTTLVERMIRHRPTALD